MDSEKDIKNNTSNKPFAIKAFKVLTVIGIFIGMIDIGAEFQSSNYSLAIFFLISLVATAIAYYGAENAKSWTPYFYFTTGVATLIFTLVFLPGLLGGTPSDLSALTTVKAIIASLFWPIIFLFYKDTYFVK